MMKTKKEIFDYLKNQGIFRIFINNCMKEFKTNNSTIYNPLKSLVCPEKVDLIIHSFTWNLAKERYDFWSKQYDRYISWKQEEEN